MNFKHELHTHRYISSQIKMKDKLVQIHLNNDYECYSQLTDVVREMFYFQ